MNWLSAAALVTLVATVLLGLLVAGIIASPLPLAILLGLLALVILAVDVFAISALLDALEDKAMFERGRH